MGLFEGRVVLVTGGGSGIGRGAALAFAREGAHVVVSDVEVVSGEETTHEIGDCGIFVRADVSRSDDVSRLVKRSVEHFGQLDIAFNNAGILLDEYDDMISVDEFRWDATMNVNVKGVWLSMKYELPHMLERGYGVIINNSSVLGLRGAAKAPAYVASKHAVIGLTKAAAVAYAQQGVRVNAICPGIIQTPLEENFMADPKEYDTVIKLYPMRRYGTVPEAAEMVLWLASDAASYLTGVVLPIDGGHMAY